MRRMLATIALLLALTLTGVLGFRAVTGQDWLDCLYLAVITLSTLGSRDPGTDTASQLFVIGYVALGLVFYTYAATTLGSILLSNDFRYALERRRMQNQINKLQQHAIVCGQGRMGFAVCEYLHHRRKPFVVIDSNQERVRAKCAKHSWLYVVGDATNDDVLKQAGIDRAIALTAALPTDADNVYVVLSARILNRSLQIIARANDEKAVEKLERAGATRVVSPITSGAQKMARFLLNPSIEDFLEIADEHGNNLELADIQLQPGSPYIGKRLLETDLGRRGVMVIGIRRASGERLMPPPGDAILQTADSLFVFGNSEAVNFVLGESKFA